MFQDKKPELIKANNSKTTKSKRSKTLHQNTCSTKTNITYDTKYNNHCKFVGENLKSIKDNNFEKHADYLGVMALIAIMELATESQTFRVNKQLLKGHPSNKIKVIMDLGSDGDLFFLPKGRDKPFPYLTRQVPKSWHMSNGTFQTNRRGNWSKIL